MKTILSRAYRVVSALLLASLLELAPLPLLMRTAHAATVPLAVNGAQHFQTMDGFGVSINSASWMNGALKPTLDTLANGGTTLWRVILDNADWEATNDNSDPATYNWTYYNSVYSSAKFQDLWNTIAYLNSKGFSGNNIVLSFMGPGPAWMGRDTLTDTDTNRSEWVEMMASVAIYGRTLAGPTGQGVQFGQYAPSNESDNNCPANHEGICMSGAMYGDVMNRLAIKLNAGGLSDLHILGPETAVVSRGTDDYMPAMMTYPTLMSKVDHFALHDYSGNTGGADTTIKNSAYPTKNLWMSEVSRFADAFPMVGQNAAAVMVWDGYDSVYNHPLLRCPVGQTCTTAPNDDGNGPALIQYSNGVYTPRKEYYQFEQLFKYVPAGAVRVAANQSASGVTTYAFTDPVSGRVTIVGYNSSASSVTFAGTLSGIATAVPSFEYYTTTSSADFARGADVPVSSNAFSVVAPAGGIFTLTYAGAPDVTPPSVPTLSANTTTPGVAGLSWSASTDNVGVTGYDVYRSTTAGFTPNAGNKIATVTPPATTYNDSIVAGTYYYKILARDGSGNTASSNEVAGTVVADTTPPSVPSSVVATALSANRIDVTWNASTDASGVASYTVLRNGSTVGTATGTTYSDTSVSASTTYSYTVSATDTAGNTSAVSSPAATATTPATSPLTASAPVIAHQTSASTSITSGSFTAHSGDLVVAFFSSDGPSGAAQSFNTPTTTGLTWSLRKRANPSGMGTAEIWSAAATGNVTGTVTATRTSGSYQGSVTVVVFSNADTTTAMATGGASGTNTAPSLSITTTRPGSQVWAAGNDWTSVVSRTPGSGQTIVDQYLPAGIGAFWVQKITNPTVTPGATTVNDTAPTTSDKWDLVALEILPILPPSDSQAPSVSLTAPIPGATVTGTQTLSATASDNVGVTKVEFYDGATLLATDTATPYTYSWDSKTAANGQHVLTAKAYDAAGNVATSSTVTVTVFNDTTPPSAPTNLQAVATSETQVTVSWSASTDNVGVTGYDLYRATGAGALSKIATIVSGTAFNDSGLAAGTAYRYCVKAFDAIPNVSASSGSVSVTTLDLTAPVFPVSAVANAQAQSTTQVLVGWPTTATDNVAVTGYVVSRALANDPGTVTALGTVSATTANLTDSGLTPGATYVYSVQAVDASGNLSAALQATVQLPVPDTQAPDQPANLSASNATATGLTLTWDKPADNVGVTGYQVWRSDVTGNPVATILSGDQLSFTDTNLTPQTTYTYLVIAVDAAGNASTAATLDASTIADLQAPTAPGNLIANNVTLTGLNLQWTPSADNVAVTGYEVWRSNSTNSPFVLVSNSPLTATTFSDSGLQSGTSYYYFVRALDAYGNTADSATLQVATLAPDTTPPTIPTLTATATSFARTHLSWVAATDAGGLASYTLQRNGQTLAALGSNVTSYDDNALTPGQTYNYTVVATDLSGNTSQSSSSVTLPTLALTAPTTGATVSGSVAVSASSVTGAAGVQFLLDGANLTAEDTTAPYGVTWDSTTTSNGTHSVAARARDNFGNTVTTAPVNVTVNNVTASLTIDVNVSVDPASTGSTIVSPTFSTNSTNELLVALVESSGPGTSAGQTIKTMTTSGLTWTMRQRANTRYGTAEIWTAPATAKLTNVSVTATRNASGYSGSMTILSFTGANTSSIGAVAKASATTGLPTLNITATTTGSIVLAAGNDWDGAAARTVGTGQTLVHQYLQTTTGDTYWAQKTTAASVGGQVITINDIAPTPSTHQWNLAAIEILPKP